LRVGYLSPDFRRHVMGYMMLEVMTRHDPEHFEIYSYSLSSLEDDVSRAIRDRSRKFESLKGLHPRAAAERIAQDELDILVDLATHTEGAVPEILAHKPARVQITSIASSGALGLSTVDFRLTDHYCDPPENQRYLLEKLLPMEGCLYPYRRLPPDEGCGHVREALGIAADAVVIGAFVNIVKLSPRCLSLWRRVMERLPGSLLAFSPNSERESSVYRSLAASAGFEAERVVFIPNDEDPAKARVRYALIDMVLDTLPYGGVNGTIEALSMGVPVVTLLGTRHGERTSYSLLMNLGVPQTVAHDEDEYVSIAARLVEDDAFRAEVKSSIRAGLKDSPLVDMGAHVRNLEDAYRSALARAHPGLS
jgi:predicted O-linked N-acetylglucosamine transferase (SPINDLY family)